ncbi:MAG: hypothetical protein LBP63_08060, partial [Prevotellaceae bacterium]|nr:hypothetical protein [Prevotellaceae bacterium]
MPNEEHKSKAERYFHSEEASDILGSLPTWIIRRGITVIFLIFVGLLIGCYFIKYPQTVDAPVIITTLNPPADLIARAEGRLDTIYVADGQNVRKNDVIALLYNTADYSAVQSVKDSLKLSYQKNFSETVFEKWMEKSYRLG